MQRCPWCLINDLEQRYHDEEWGVPVHDDRKQFEFLMLEMMQCGLSWDTILRKREIFRQSFDGFDADRIADYTELDVDRIMETPGMIRSRRKIQAVVHNAGCFQAIRRQFGTFSDYLWAWTGGKTMVYRSHAKGDIPAYNTLSETIAEDLKKRGMKYIGRVTIYAHLQACGIINDHICDCFRYRILLDQGNSRIIEEAQGAE